MSDASPQANMRVRVPCRNRIAANWANTATEPASATDDHRTGYIVANMPPTITTAATRDVTKGAVNRRPPTATLPVTPGPSRQREGHRRPPSRGKAAPFAVDCVDGLDRRESRNASDAER